MTEIKRPQILLSNDDSINSPGLWAAAEALSTLGYVHVVAPRVQQTSMGGRCARFGRHQRNPELVVNGQTWQVHGWRSPRVSLYGLLNVMEI